MPKFSSKPIQKDGVNEKGEPIKIWDTVWIPLDDTAKVSPIVDKAVDAGEYTREKDEVKNAKARLLKLSKANSRVF